MTTIPSASLIGTPIRILADRYAPLAELHRTLAALGATEITQRLATGEGLRNWLADAFRSGRAGRQLHLLVLTPASLQTSALLLRLVMLAMLRLRGAECLIYAPELMHSTLGSWQRFLVRNLLSLAGGVLVSDDNQRREFTDCNDKLAIVPLLPVTTGTAMGHPATIQPSIQAYASSDEEAVLLGHVAARTRLKYPRTTMTITRLDQPASDETPGPNATPADVLLILSPRSYSTHAVQTAIASGAIPILPDLPLPGLARGSSLALVIAPLHLEQAVTGLCQLVEKPELVATLRDSAARYRHGQKISDIQTAWGDSLRRLRRFH